MQAALAGWRRIPVSGRTGASEDPGDAAAGHFYVEMRSRNEPRPIRWFAEVSREAAKHAQVPLLIFRGPRSSLSPLAIMLWADLAEVIQLAQRAADAGPAAHDASHHPVPGPTPPGA